MCLMKIWLPSFNPYSVLLKGQRKTYKSEKNISSTWMKNDCAATPTGLTVCQFLLHQCRLNGFVWGILVGESLVA